MNSSTLHRNISRLLIVGLFFTGIQQAFAQSEPALLRVSIETENVIQRQAELEAAGYDVLTSSIVDSTLDVVVSDEELQALQELGLQIVNIERGQALRNIHPIYDGSDSLRPGYLDLDAINARMYELAATFPDIAQVVNLTEAYNVPATFEGRSLFALKISDNVNIQEDETAIMVVANHHAREVVTPVIALNAMDELTQGYGVDQRITDVVNNNEIWIAPTWNPDGYNHVVIADSLWRKNRKVLSGGIGVDQNRNYPQGWDSNCSGSTSHSSNTYRGNIPASEAETQTMMAWSQDQHFAKVIDFHSRGREVLYGQGCLSHPFTSLMKKQAIALSRAAGYNGQVRPPSATGEHFQWQFAQMGAWSHLIETAVEFQPPYNSAKNEADRVWPGILFALEKTVSFSGHVTDAQTGAPITANLDFINVNFSNGESYNSGGLYGRYNALLPAGTFQVQFSATGYQSVEYSITLDTDSSVEVLNVQLQPDNTSDNLPPVADAGANQTVEAGSHVILSGSGSDPDGAVVAYQWTQVSGSAIDLINANTATAEFTAPSVTADTAFIFKLKVTDNLGLSARDRIKVTVVAPEPNQAPTVDAGSDQSVAEGSSVTLSGSAFDPDGEIVAYQWTQVSGATVDLSGANTATAIFTAPQVDADTQLVFSLEVTDDQGLTANDQVTISVADLSTGEGADLLIDSLTYGLKFGNQIRVGKLLAVDTVVANSGSALAAENSLRWVLSTDPVIDMSDRHLGSGLRKVRELDSGSSRLMKGVFRIPLSVEPGTYYLGAIVDTANIVAESNESNNTVAVQIIIKPKWVRP